MLLLRSRSTNSAGEMSVPNAGHPAPSSTMGRGNATNACYYSHAHEYMPAVEGVAPPSRQKWAICNSGCRHLRHKVCFMHSLILPRHTRNNNGVNLSRQLVSGDFPPVVDFRDIRHSFRSLSPIVVQHRHRLSGDLSSVNH
jgi:hypothetical protein